MALIPMEKIEQITTDNFLQQLEKLCFDSRVLDAHNEWEKTDLDWKESKKRHNMSDSALLSDTARVRNAKNVKDVIFDEAAHLANVMAAKVNIIEHYEGDTLCDARIIDDVEEGSLEWLNMRRRGVGGSSIMEALGFHWKSRPGDPVYMTDDEKIHHWEQMGIEKCTPIVDKKDTTTGVLYRGHMWEPALITWYALKNNVRVGASKATWKGKHSLQVVNVDGLVLDNNGQPYGLLECKTSSREWTWNWGVPMHYRAQVLWYLEAFGLEWCDVIVKFDSGFIETKRINRGETIDGTARTKTIPEYYTELEELWNTYVQPLKDNPDKVWDEGQPYGFRYGDMDAVIPGVETNPRLWDIVANSDLITLDLCAPYERMPQRFTVVAGCETSRSDGYVAYSDISPVFYPVSEKYIFATPVDYDKKPLDSLVDTNVVIAIDDATYHYLVDIMDWASVINLSDLRRLIDVKPGWDSFHTLAEAQEWINAHKN